MATVASGIGQVRLWDPDLFVPGVPHEVFETLRREAPVYWHDEPDGPGFWVLTRHDDIVAANRDATAFSSERGGVILWSDRDPAMLEQQRRMMLNMDPPHHTKLRKIVNRGFTPRMVNDLEAHIRVLANQIIDKVAPLGRCDFVADIAAELPLQVIAEMMGVPLEDRHHLFEWSNRLIGFDDPEYNVTPERQQEAAAELFLYANGLAAERLAKGEEHRDDIINALLFSQVDGDRLSEVEFDLFFLLLAVAGNETTRNLVSHAMLALIEHPEERARLLADPSLLTTAVEEMLRWGTPVMYFRRTATTEIELGGQRIREGDKVTMWHISGNRDETCFPEPYRFDVGRTPNDHIAFGGGGPHFCLGANLARLEIRVMFEELLRRLPDIELDGPVARLRSNFINGIKRMPVRFSESPVSA
jgi:cholest-4-en-3-one 26-monooxygenase